MELQYESVGDGEPVILMHAAIADLRMWDAQVDEFASAGYRVVRFDAQGFGRSPAAAQPQTRAKDLLDLLDHLRIDRAHLMGVSFGGTAVIDFAVEHPSRLGALVAVAPGLSGYDPPDSAAVQRQMQAEAEADAALERDDLDLATELNLRMWVAGPRRTLEDLDKQFVARAREMMRLALERDAERTNAAQIDPPAAGRLGSITAPTLLVLGEEDVDLVRETVDYIAQQVPGAEVLSLPDAAHLLPLERPAEFNLAVLNFLKRHSLSQ
jgi:pimeloyl-ACP methyl ester carboxylesterase